MRVVHHAKAYRAVLTDPKLVADLRRRAEQIAAASGEGYEAKSEPLPKRRARAAVVTVSAKAKRENSAENTLIRNLSAGK